MSKKCNHIKRFITYISQNIPVCISAFILAIQFLLISICNLKLIDNNIDCDNAKMFVHIIKMWEHKTLFIPDWSYVSTLELDCSSILALPIYALTNNIYLSYGLANIILLASFIAMIFYLFQDKPILYPLFASNLFCIPYAIGMLDYFNMMFFAGSQYIIKATLPILLIAVIANGERKTIHTKPFIKILPLAFLNLLLFFSSLSSGVYVLFVGVFPILVTYILYKVLTSEKIPAHAYITFISNIILSIAGIILNNIFVGGGRGGGMVLISAHQILSNISSCLTGIFELFGGIAYDLDIAVLSFQGISTLLKSAIVHIFLICGIIAVSKIIKSKADLRTLLLVSVFIWNIFVLFATNTRAGSATYEYRYHLIGMLPLICVSATVLLDTWHKLNPLPQKFFTIVGVCFLVGINLFSFPSTLDPTDEQAELKQLCSYCSTLDMDYVYLYDASNDADMCRLIAQDDAQYLCVTPGGVTWAYDYYEKYVDGPIYSENAIFVVDNRYDFGDSFEAFGYKFVKFDTIANRTLYYFAN